MKVNMYYTSKNENYRKYGIVILALPGIVVVGGVVILSIGFEHVIRAISGYWE